MTMLNKSDQLLSSVCKWTGFLLGSVMVVLTIGNLGTPIDSAKDVLDAFRQDRLDAFGLGVASLFFILALPRPASQKRIRVALLVGIGSGIVIWGCLAGSQYVMLRARGIDAIKVLQSASPQSDN
jgi:xanthine/uracil permease